MGRFHVRIEPGVDVTKALIVIGTPTIGLVGAIAAQHLVRTLGMRPVGCIDARDLPPVVRIRDGRSHPVMEIYEAGADCKLGVSCARLLVLATEITPEDDLLREFASDITAWAKGIHAPLVLVPDGMEHDDSPQTHVFGVANTTQGRAFLDAVEVPALKEGLLGGLSAAFLDEGERHGVPVVTLLGETTPDLPDARAAASILQVLARVVPGLPIDTAPLLADAEAIERAMRDAMERAQPKADESGASMFG